MYIPVDTVLQSQQHDVAFVLCWVAHGGGNAAATEATD